MRSHEKIGKFLLEAKALNQKDLAEALSKQRHSRKKIGEILVESNTLSNDRFTDLLAEFLEIPYVDLTNFNIDETLVNLLPERFIKNNWVLPILKVGAELTLAMVNPNDISTVDEVHQMTGLSTDVVLASERDMKLVLDRMFGKKSAEIMKNKFEQVMQDIKTEDVETIALRDEPEEEISLLEAAAETPIIRLVNLIIVGAVRERASDIHVEPQEHNLLVRYRVDGMLIDALQIEQKFQPAVLSRLKIISGLDIAEKRHPQDGRFQMRIEEQAIDFRISTFPTIYGENVVLRILDKSSILLNLDDLGFSERDLSVFKEMLSNPHGIILVTGPTGSGKTTTLYSALNFINSIEKNIITVEDPVEYRLDLIRQSQVNPKIGYTFAKGLRSILRQDPDVIMVGEIRDSETAHIAVESALTGHLVLSTLHTNSAPAAISRLSDMGIESFLVASSLVGVMAQRLVRKLCNDCKTSYEPDELIFQRLGIVRPPNQYTFFRPGGCKQCNQSGYRGRIGIYEIMAVDEEIRTMVIKNDSSEHIANAAIRNGMKTLRLDGVRKIASGITSVEELMRVTSSH